MSFRLMFLTGHLSGLLLAAALVWTYASNRPLATQGTSIRPTGSNWLPSGYSSGPQFPQLRTFDPNLHAVPPAVPRGWKPHHFNGQLYYVIPIETVNRLSAT